MDMGSSLMDAKVELLISMATKKMQEQINQLNAKIDLLSVQVSDLAHAPKEKVYVTQPVSQVVQPAEQVVMEAASPRPEIRIIRQETAQPQGTRAATQESSPRVGNFQPGDINLDTFFYCGNKKK